MGTPNSTNDSFARTFADLNKSEMAEEKEFAAEMRSVLVRLIWDLKPLMKYIDKHLGNYRGIEVCCVDGSVLLLSREGMWGVRDENGSYYGGDEWEVFPFKMIVEGLQEALTRAEGERRSRLHSISSARTKLDEIAAILKR